MSKPYDAIQGKDEPGVSELSRAYKTEPTVENYLLLRRKFPDETIEISTSWGLEWCLNNEARIIGLGINFDDVVGALDADATCISRLSLKLMELILDRDQKTRAGQTQVVGRGEAISDSLLHYLISMMLDAYSSNNQLDISRDLIVLIKHQFRVHASVEETQMNVKVQMHSAAWIAAQLKIEGQSGSMRQVAKILHVQPSTVLRWFSDRSFEEEVEKAIRAIQSDDYPDSS